MEFLLSRLPAYSRYNILNKYVCNHQRLCKNHHSIFVSCTINSLISIHRGLQMPPPVKSRFGRVIVIFPQNFHVQQMTNFWWTLYNVYPASCYTYGSFQRARTVRFLNNSWWIKQNHHTFLTAFERNILLSLYGG